MCQLTYSFLDPHQLVRFLWSGQLGGPCHFKVAWTDCCIPKDEGGLGIRNIFDWNRSAILLQIWRVSLPTSASLWILWLHNCLFKKRPFWTAVIPHACPWTVRKMINYRAQASAFLSYKIGPCSKFYLWHDPCITRGPLIHHLGESIVSISESSNLARLGSLMLDNSWNGPSSNHTLDIELRHLLSLISVDVADEVLWDGLKNISMSTVWNFIRLHSVAPAWIGAVWHNFHIPKCALFTWLAFRNKLFTKDKMLFLGFNVNVACVLCGHPVENVQHLFSQCPVACLLLQSCPISLSPCWKDWLDGSFSPGRHDGIMMDWGLLFFSAVIHTVWSERNSMLHSSKIRIAGQLLLVVKSMVREKLFTCNKWKKYAIKHPSIISLLY